MAFNLSDVKDLDVGASAFPYEDWNIFLMKAVGSESPKLIHDGIQLHGWSGSGDLGKQAAVSSLRLSKFLN